MLENYLDEVIDNENYEESDDEEDDKMMRLIYIKVHYFFTYSILFETSIPYRWLLGNNI